MLPHTEVINMGVHGYGHDQMLILFGEEGVKYEPDIVILGFLRFIPFSAPLMRTEVPLPWRFKHPSGTIAFYS
jgi:hypothetical protein